MAAVILAGGKGQRLGGVNKALLVVAGITLLDRALAVTGECDLRVLSVGPEDWAGGGEIEHIVDLATDYGGPLAGVAAAVERLAGEPPDAMFTLAVDTPMFPPDFLARALSLIETVPAILASYAGQDYPTNALWRFEAIHNLPAEVRAGTAPHSLKRMAEALGAARLDYAQFTQTDPFLNVNTPEDLAFLRGEVERRTGG